MLNLTEDPLANYMPEMALHFKTLLDETNDSSTITIDNGRGKGFISSYLVFPGLRVWVFNIIFRSDFKIRLKFSKKGLIYFSYNVKGHFFHGFQDDDAFLDILQNQHLIIAGSTNVEAKIVYPANTKLKIAIIGIDMVTLGKANARNAKRIHSRVQKLFRFDHESQAFRHLGSIDTETKKYAALVCKNYDKDLVGELLTEGAVLNMFASQIQAYIRDTNDSVSVPPLRNAELARITSLGDYVMDHLDQELSVLGLSKIFEMSVKKLQLGIQHLYGVSVGRYVTNLRMGQAKHLINTTDLSCSEVSYRVGISSLSYFSKLFKERHGISPSLIKGSVKD
ncbi:hypothetical protein LCGC14_0651790 [marine sediment metagenome]